MTSPERAQVQSLTASLKALLEGAPSAGDALGMDQDVEWDTQAEFGVNTTYSPRQCARRAAPGHRVRVHYVGKLLANGRTFTSTFHTGSIPKRFILGSDSEPVGLSRGIAGMCVDERRSITVPWALAFGDSGEPSLGVPPRADVQFFVELVSASQNPAKGYEHLDKGEEL
jgi:FKBP-type peptidyl-prolyl cis-trans isomerase